MERETAIITVRTAWQTLASLGKEADREASKAKDVLDLLSDRSLELKGHEVSGMVDEVMGMMRASQDNDSAQRTPASKQYTTSPRHTIH